MFLPQTSQEVFATNSASYCRITTETILYKSPNSSQNLNNLFFKPTPTYFAYIEENLDEFYKVNYMGCVGYVKKQEVTPVYQSPKTPFPKDITFNITNSASAVVRDIPSTDGKFVGLVPCSATLTYIGDIDGDEAITGLGTKWYYVNFSSFEQGNICGYIYAPLTENLSPISPNEEDLSTVPASSEPLENIISPQLLSTNNLLIIGGLLIAGIMLILLIFIPFRKTKKETAFLNQHSQLTYDDHKKIDNNNFDF